MPRMEMVMCRSCGNFTEVKRNNGKWEVVKDECPECGGREFKKTDTGEIIRTEG